MFYLGKIEAVAFALHVPLVVCAACGLRPGEFMRLTSGQSLRLPYNNNNKFAFATCVRGLRTFEHVMALFSKRLTCFYCGRRIAQPVNGPVRKFHCQHCDADNYLDQVRSMKQRVHLMD